MKKIIAILLAVFMMAGVMISCNNNGDISDESSGVDTTSESTSEEASSQTSEESSEESSQTTEDTESDSPLKPSDYTIVHALYSGLEAVDATEDLKNAFDKYANTEIPVLKENYYNSLNPGMSGNKVVVGYVEKDVAAMEIYNSLHTPSSYVIKFVGNSLYIIGGSGAATAEAVGIFIDEYLSKYGVLVFEVSDLIAVENNDPPRFPNLTISGTPLENYVIVHDGTLTGEIYAKKLKSVLEARTGITLFLKKAAEEADEYEILVGKTIRSESAYVRSEYGRPNVYYDVRVVDKKLVCMGEGLQTLDALVSAFDEHLKVRDTSQSDLSGSVISSDILDALNEKSMLTRAAETELRVLNYNVFGSTYNYTDYIFFKNNSERGEAIGDLMMSYDPDIITTNELYFNSDIYRAIMKQIGDTYMLIDSTYDDGNPFENSTSGGRKNPEQIFIKKSCNFTVVDSGWRYLSEGGDKVVTYHGIHWAVLQTESGQKFIVSVGHYGESNSTNVYAVEHQAAIAMAQASSGSSEALPVIAAGDFFSHVDRGAAYMHHTATCGLLDPQKVESINCNDSIRQATCHGFGSTAGNGTRYDFILHSDLLTPLKFKVLKEGALSYTSDHYPVCVDFKFT